MDYRRWMIGRFYTIVSVGCGWLAWYFHSNPADMAIPGMITIVLLPLVGSIIFALLSIPAFVMPVRLTITHEEVALYRIQLSVRRNRDREMENQGGYPPSTSRPSRRVTEERR